MNACGCLWCAKAQCLVTHAANKTPHLTSFQGIGLHIQKTLRFFSPPPLSLTAAQDPGESGKVITIYTVMIGLRKDQ